MRVNTENELDSAVYEECIGIAVPDVAIKKTKRWTEETGRAGKNRYTQSDMPRYVPAQKFDVILLRESIYYAPPRKIKPMLDRYSKYLKEAGVSVIRMFDLRGKYRMIVENGSELRGRGKAIDRPAEGGSHRPSIVQLVAIKRHRVKRKMASLLKYSLTRVGELLSSDTVYNLNAAVNYLEVGRWMRANSYDVSHRVDCRERLFDLVGAQVSQREVLYLEFGVFEGAATRYWSKLLRNPRSKLHGFDSFEGLPESWLPRRRKGHFSVQGQVPQMDDPRVEFFKGWFEQTLPAYKLPPHDVLVLNFDADLYSPTAFLLTALEAAIVPGTYLYFDEFNHRYHELRAFDEFIKRTGMKFNVLGVTRTLEHSLFQRVS